MPRYKILHVDDDRDIRALAHIALAEIGDFDVRQCSSGADALSALEDFAADLILLDAMMPGLSGEDTLKKMQDGMRLANTPVVFATAKIGAADYERLMKLGATDVIAKPFDPITLAGRLLKIIEA